MPHYDHLAEQTLSRRHTLGTNPTAYIGSTIELAKKHLILLRG